MKGGGCEKWKKMWQRKENNYLGGGEEDVRKKGYENVWERMWMKKERRRMWQGKEEDVMRKGEELRKK